MANNKWDDRDKTLHCIGYPFSIKHHYQASIFNFFFTKIQIFKAGDAYVLGPEYHKRGYRDPDDPRLEKIYLFHG